MAPNLHMGKIQMQFWMGHWGLTLCTFFCFIKCVFFFFPFTCEGVKMGMWPRRVTNQWCADVFLTTDFSEKKRLDL